MSKTTKRLGVVFAIIVAATWIGQSRPDPKNDQTAFQRRQDAANVLADRLAATNYARSEAAFRAQLKAAASAGGIVGKVPAPGTCRYRSGDLPDRRCTPGARNPRVVQSTIDTTICVSGWTRTVRPPTSVTEPFKFKMLAAYGQLAKPSLYELDHLIPLELGGAPASVHNLWPEPHAGGDGSIAKDAQENRLKAMVCSGAILLREAQRRMLAWPS